MSLPNSSLPIATLLTAIAFVLRPAPALAEQPAPIDDPRAAVARMLPQCEPQFAEIDARIARAGVSDASYYRVAGFPYLRTDRLMSSFNGELDDDEALEAWLLQLRDNDQFSRDIELRNLGMDTRERTTLLLDLRLCAVWLSFLESGDPQRRRAMIRAARVPESSATDPAVAQAAKPASAATVQRWRTPVDTTEVARLLERYEKLPQDPLGRKGMTSDGWQALAAHFAPTWQIERAGTGDEPGALHWRGKQLVVDQARPTLYYLASFARAGKQLLVQFHYFVWFAAADGRIDGLIWRVTLDAQGRPLIYDSLRADGSDHRFHLAQTLEPISAEAKHAAAPAITGVGPVQVRLHAGSHVVVEVTPEQGRSVADETRTYVLRPYEDLLTMPRDDGSSLSAFDADGVLRQTGSAIRQWGRHATLPSLKLAFDDPHLIESRFRLPTHLSPERYALFGSFHASSP
jgi:hypothetical protein